MFHLIHYGCKFVRSAKNTLVPVGATPVRLAPYCAVIVYGRGSG